MIQVSGTFYVSGGGGGGIIDAIRAEVLPPVVVNGQLVILTDIPALAITLGYSLPASPAAGDIWVHLVDNGFYPVRITDGIKIAIITPGLVLQYIAGEWVYREAYIGMNDSWMMCSTHSPLASLSWEAVEALSNSGEDMSTLFEVGDQIDMRLSTGEYIPVQIVGFGHDDLADETGKAAITFGAVHCMETTRRWEAVRGNSNWSNCEINGVLHNEILPQFPDAVKSMIRPVAKKYGTNRNMTTIQAQSNSIFLYSVIELFPTIPGWVSAGAVNEGITYPFFTTGFRRIKDRLGDTQAWYTRTPNTYSGSDNNVVCVGSAGSADVQTNGTQARGIAPVFCIGRVTA